MSEQVAIEQFRADAGDPRAADHAAVSRWVEEAAATMIDRRDWYGELALKSLDSGTFLLDAVPIQETRFVLAALVQTRHWDDQIRRLRTSLKSGLEQAGLPLRPEWKPLRIRQDQSLAVVKALLRRSLPFERAELMAFIAWLLESGQVLHRLPIGSLAKALQRYAAGNPLGAELRDAIRKLAATLRASNNKEAMRWGTTLEQLCEEPTEPTPRAGRASLPPPQPSAAGNPLVLHQLKSHLGIAAVETAVTIIGPDRYPMVAVSPLIHEHTVLTAYLSEIAGIRGYRWEMVEFATGRALLEADPSARARILLAAAERHVDALLHPTTDFNDQPHYRSRYATPGVVKSFAGTSPQFDREQLFDLALYLSLRPLWHRTQDQADATLIPALEAILAGGAPLTEGERFALYLWRNTRIVGPPLGIHSHDVDRLTHWIGDGAQFYLVPGECWSDAVNADLAKTPLNVCSQWVTLLKHMLTATGARPSERWRATALKLASAAGNSEVHNALLRWLPLIAKGRTHPKTTLFLGDTIHDENANALRGLLWLLPLLPSRKELLRLPAAVALAAYRKVPGVGPRAVKVGNAAVFALSQMVSPEAIGQLAMLKVRVRFGTAQKEVEKAFDAAALELQLPRDQIEEISVPTCGLETVGRHDEAVGEYRAELTVNGSEAELEWFDARSKKIKSVPAAVKKDHAETLKELRQDLKDLQAMLSAQTDRIDGLFLERKTWSACVWRERYIDHPLVGTIARRLIWSIDATPIIAIDGEPTDVDGQSLVIPAGATVSLWHPASKSIDEVVAWRRRIETLGIVQPFKQAHREVYLLTGAEERTDTYSNRFAAHILRQHQFNALCGARRWKNKLRLMVDDNCPPASRELPAWGLRAEFWIEGVGDTYGQDTNDAGVFLRLASDQVRFYRIEAATNSAHASGGGYISNGRGPGEGDINQPVSLVDVPPLVFSEIMRDVDLFVGVASIGNDPTWNDGGPGGRFREYWHGYSFGELSATAVTRREVLERLLPRLKIAVRCTLADRFLTVRGDKRTYKIHLGSGNILMEPNDQYLCIVPDSRARSTNEPVYLPFEGDATLSIILSKAFLLADDTKIKDPVILRQIN